ncbi:MAG: LytTR family DNA-binding domain-containing protein [Bacteroidota bacterium]|nr:LytTR family DNA-binding domain-containing protein [Bacteroidota bacterium]
MNCIVIDDDSLSRKILKEFIDRTDFLDLIYSYTNAVEAINNYNNKTEIHLIFLDIEMPEMSGIDFLRSLKNAPQVIIVSSREKYALESYQYDVTDYLLKPVSYGRFFSSVERARKRMSKEKTTLTTHSERDEIFIKKNSSLVRLKYDNILWIEALENYVVVNTFDEKYTIHFTMRAILSNLPENKFIRVHRSYIANIHKINMIEDNSIVIKTASGTKVIPIGKSYRDHLYGEINLIMK